MIFRAVKSIKYSNDRHQTTCSVKTKIKKPIIMECWIRILHLIALYLLMYFIIVVNVLMYLSAMINANVDD